MPAVIELRLHARQPVEATTRQLHGLACAFFETRDDSSSHTNPDKPFTVWPLSRGPDEREDERLLRVSWLRADLPPDLAGVSSQLRLGHLTCAVTSATCRQVTHAELAAGPGHSAIYAEFLSPAYFSQNGTDVVLPDPRLILGSWRRRWNASLPAGDVLAIGDEGWRDIHRSARLAEFSLRTEYMDSGRGRDRAGFTGWATITLGREAPAAASSMLGALARFAEFSGTGAQTTHGFGATSVSSQACRPASASGVSAASQVLAERR
jgi:CRISPR-associated endoribonuclease Cas6